MVETLVYEIKKLIEIGNFKKDNLKAYNAKIGQLRYLKNKLNRIKNREERAKTEEEINNLERQTIPYWYKKLLNEVIKKLESLKISELNEEEFIQPEGIAEAIAIGLEFKRTQLRKFFSEIKDIKMQFSQTQLDKNNIKVQIVSLIPKLAYSKGRGLIDEEFYQFMKILLNKLREEPTKDNFKKFEQIFEAIIAYHTYYNPKED